MGNRATIEIKDHLGDAPAYIYLHWGGSPDSVVDAVKAAAPRMRKGDAYYATARLVGELHNRIEGGLSLGLMPAETSNRDAWDNGHYIIDLGAGRIEREIQIDDDTTAGTVEAEGIEFGGF